ncbi:unnamed protein product [Blepharisma stoltei]|uniref:Uncharacterized protein n=1 Tax=Blepharisma stoltei TaxID=1481888 RepID=A0AAU9I973_9CILI|nr:unnamed protein product [Blepharisma stoltei]
MGSLDTIPVDIIRYHILPFIRDPRTFVYIGGVNHSLRHSWKNLGHSITDLVKERIPSFENLHKEVESEMQTDKCPGLTKDLHFAAVAVDNIDYRQIDYNDEHALYLLSVFWVYLMMTTEPATKEEILELFNKENAIENLEHVDPRWVERKMVDKVIEMIATAQWREVEGRFMGQKEEPIITWIKHFTRYLQIGQLVQENQRKEEYYADSIDRLKNIIKNQHQIWRP